MKTKHALAAFSILAAAFGAHAETYEGPHKPVSALKRSDVAATAVAAAKSGDPYNDVAVNGVTPALPTPASRAKVREQAVAAAYSKQHQYLSVYVNSKIPVASTMSSRS